MNHVMRDRRKEARLVREHEASMALKRRWYRPKITAWIGIIFTTILLFSLGFWQLNRLAWKEGLVHAIEASRYTKAIEGLPKDTQALGFARVHLVGEYLHDYEIHLAARYYQSQLGYHILTPFQLEDGRIALVNRGWVKADEKNPATRTSGQVTGKQSIIVMIRNDNDRSYFTPDPSVKENVWFWRDLNAIGNSTGLDLAPVNMDVLYDAPSGGKPHPSDGLIELRNDHLGYALTWFCIGVTGLLTFIMFHYRLPDPIKEA
jgi:surfeit locus 1 family protein